MLLRSGRRFLQAKAEFADYYKNSLLYLACINLDKDLTPEERTSRAHDLGISALLGTIYNFGELVSLFVFFFVLSDATSWRSSNL